MKICGFFENICLPQLCVQLFSFDFRSIKMHFWIWFVIYFNNFYEIWCQFNCQISFEDVLITFLIFLFRSFIYFIRQLIFLNGENFLSLINRFFLISVAEFSGNMTVDILHKLSFMRFLAFACCKNANNAGNNAHLCFYS